MPAQPAPKVSIGLPVYNGENYLELALQSLLDQTFPDLEIIVSDNGSTDRTDAICRQYAAQDSRIRYYRNEKNLGASRNFNLTFERARVQYFKWAAHDDLVAPTYVQRCVEVMDEDPSVVLCFSRTQVIDDSGCALSVKRVDPRMVADRPSDRWYGHVYVGGHVCYPIFGLIRSSVLAETPLIEPYAGSDRILLARLVLAGRLHEFRETLFIARDHPKRSVRALQPHLRAQWFDPRERGTVSFPKWRLLRELIGVVAASDLSDSDRRRCYAILAKWMLDRTPHLIEDLRNAAPIVLSNAYHRFRHRLDARRRRVPAAASRDEHPHEHSAEVEA